MVRAGSRRKPASAVRNTKGRGSVLTCAMRPLRRMSHATIMTTSRSWSGGRSARMSAAHPCLARHGDGRESAHEDVERLLRPGLVTSENVHEGESALGQRVNAHMTGIEKQHGGNSACLLYTSDAADE